MMVKKMISLGRTGKPEEVSKVITFLASDEASYLTGNVVNIDGGLWL
jgi:NAD(P)-dependent dehydrogenase (short-subunit alcohol dehydrogenase family)